MKNFILLLALICSATFIEAQTPMGFNYQAVIRNGSGTPIASQTVNLQITIQRASGTPYYTERKSVLSNAQGVVSYPVGSGTPTYGQIDTIPWHYGDFQLKVEIDLAGTGSYTQMGNPTQIQSVPYALYAKSVNEVASSTSAADSDPIFVVRNKVGQIVFAVYQTGVRIYVEDTPIVKGAKGGFAVGGLSNQSKATVEYFRITPDSARVYVNEVTTVKGAKGGFAVGGLSNQSKTTNVEYFDVSPSSSPTIIQDNAQMLWYPLKEAFLVGRVQVLDPSEVGLNSFSSGYHSKAMGNYSQAMGTNCEASNLYATAIGESCIASGQYSFAFGSQAQATNTNNIAIGYQSISSGTSNCYAFGKLAMVTSYSSNSYAFGNSAQVLSYSTNSYALGNSSLVSGSTDCYSFGTNASVSGGLNSYAIGSNSKVSYGLNTAWGSYAIGDNAQCYGQRAYALGSHARALNNDAIAIGTNTKATAYTSIAIGANGSNPDTTYATGQASIAFGYAANSGSSSSIALGTRSNASSSYSIALGYQTASSAYGSVSIGYSSTASGNYAYALGSNAVASGNYSVAIGSANTNSHAGSIVIGDNSGSALNASADNQFVVRASGGTIIYSSNGTNGVTLAAGGGSWTSVSDVHKKENFKNEDPEDYLDKLSGINIQSWNYKAQSPSIRHIGITAQDFYKNFRFGESDTTITEIDLAGVNMIAIKGLIDRNASLNQKVQEQEQKIESLEKDYAILKSQLEEFKNLINQLKK